MENDKKENTVRLDIRMTKKERDFIKAQAALKGMKLYEYIMSLVYADVERRKKEDESK